MTPFDIVHSDMDASLPEVESEMSKNGYTTHESILMAKNSSKIPVEIATHFFKLQGKEVILAISRDITERKRAEKELKESEQKYRTLFNSSPDYTILIGTNGKLIDVNEAAQKAVGLSKEELIGKNFTKLGLLLDEEMPSHMENVSHILKGKHIKPHESKFIDKNGEIRHAETYLTPLEKDNEIYAFNVISHDISERKKAEEGIKASLKEKELLLREIHHRVKNNLQIINSLLSLQTRYIKDEGTLNIFKESQNRVRSMAIIHEKLYNSSNLVKIDFEEYVKDLANNLFYTYKINPYNIKLNTDIDNILFDIETAIPCGLIINELVSNCLKHAFNGLNKGKINITLNQIGEEFTLSVSDNGIGLPEDFNFTNTDSLGLLMINNLVKQLDGTIELDKNGGTTFKIIFKELKYKERI
jgi:PAS domain S-box-containing protein